MTTRSEKGRSGIGFGGVYPLPTPLTLDDSTTWMPHHLFSGHTSGMYDCSVHVSALASGATPHPPHVHDQEEVLLMLAGEADIVVPEAPIDASEARVHLTPGRFAYYPSRFPHTLLTTSAEPANYLMFRWSNLKPMSRAGRLRFGVFDTQSDVPVTCSHAVERARSAGPAESGLVSRVVFDGPTAFLSRFHCHVSTLAPGAGYPPHADPYDVGLVLLEGEVETLGRRVGPQAVIAYPQGKAHGMRNPAETAARYVVFEFQGAPTPLLSRAGDLIRRSPRRALRRARRTLAAARRGG